MTQLGGKGTIRQKKKNTNRRKSDQLKFQLEKTITEINNKLPRLSTENKKQLTNIINKDLKNLITKIQKKDLQKIKIQELKILGESFFHKLFFYIENNIIILLRNDIYSKINEYFINQSKELCFKFIFILNDLLVITKQEDTKEQDEKLKKEQEEKLKKDKQYDPDLFNQSLNYFNLSHDTKQHFKNILDKYNESEKNQESEFHFNRLKLQYENYLLSYL